MMKLKNEWLGNITARSENNTDIAATGEIVGLQQNNSCINIGSGFKEDTNNINNGYPILNWQNNSTMTS